MSFSAVTPGPTSSFTRHRSAAAVIGWLAHRRRLQLLALLHQPHRDDGGVGVGMEGGLDAVIAGKRLGQRGRQMAAGGQQQRRGDRWLLA